MKKLLLLLTAFTLLLTACEDNTNNNTNNDTDPPVKNITLPSESSSLNPADTIIVKGEGFLQNDQILLRPSTKAENTTIQAKVTQITATTLAFTVPTTTAGTFEILLLRNGKQYTLGKLTFETPKAEEHDLYALKIWLDTANAKDVHQVIKLDINTGAETLITDIERKHLMFSATYLSSTKEYVGIDTAQGFVKVNVETGKISYVPLPNPKAYERKIVQDENENIYTCKSWKENSVEKKQIVKLDPKTGTETPIVNVEGMDWFYSYTYLPSTKEYIGTSDKLVKINLQTKKITTVPLAGELATDITEMIADKNDNLYAIKSFDSFEGNLIKIDKNTGAETVIAKTIYPVTIVSCTYLPSTNEYIVTNTSEKLFRINLTTGATTTIPLRYQAEYTNIVID